MLVEFWDMINKDRVLLSTDMIGSVEEYDEERTIIRTKFLGPDLKGNIVNWRYEVRGGFDQIKALLANVMPVMHST